MSPTASCRIRSVRKRGTPRRPGPIRLGFGVNFINIIRTNFLYAFHFSSYLLALSKNLYEKRSRITLMKLTLCVTFINIFWTKVLCSTFLSLQFGFEFFWRENISLKTVLKTLMKLTIGGQFNQHGNVLLLHAQML